MQYTVGLAVLWANLLVIWFGLKRGIERVSEVFVPFFFLVALYLVYVALSLPGAGAAVAEFLRPDFSRIGARELFAALGQCFFSVGLGASFALVYGKFIRSDASLAGVALLSAGGDTLASLLAALFIVPAVMVFGLQLNAGPGLLFETQPSLLATMPAGRIVGSFLLLALALVSFLSSIAVFQVVSVSLGEEPVGNWLGRGRLLLLIGLVETLLMIYPGWHPGIIAVLDLVIGSGFMLAGGLLAVVAITWSQDRAATIAHIFGTTRPGVLVTLLYLWMRFVIPLAIASILVAIVVDTITG